ncbi:MAG: hypothetical protein AB7U98_00385 [Candidatus Nitrosocosmicus sp.]
MLLGAIVDKTNKPRLGLLLITLGALLLSLLLVIQYKYIDSFTNATGIVVSEVQIEFMNSIAVPTFILFMLFSSLIILGIMLIFKRQNRIITEYDFGQAEKGWKILLYGISLAFGNRLTKKIIIIVFASYLSISLFLNNTILFQPTMSMGVEQSTFVPSIFTIGCCGSPGTFPVINLHITEYLGLKFVPVNLILPMFYSLLVSLTLALTVGAFCANKKRIRCYKTNKVCYMNSIGVVSGFLISCPSCITNIAISSIFGTGLITSAYVLILPYQVAISTFSFVFMLVALYFGAKFLYDSKKQSNNQ